MCTSPIYKKNERYQGPWQERIFSIPCGKCEECQRKIQNDWFVRAKIELHSSVAAFFCTLTYNDLYLPIADECFSVPVLCKKDLSDFFKRLRNHFIYYDPSGKKKLIPIKYLACGEYGGLSGRPHYHFILFLPKEYYHELREDLIDEIREKVSLSWSVEVTNNGSKLLDGNGKPIRQAFGNVTVDYSNDHRIRYVVKYMLKGQFSEGEELIPSFRLVSHGLGLRGFDTDIKDLDHLCFTDDGGYTYGLPRYLREKVFKDNQRLKYQFKLREAKKQVDLTDYHRRMRSQHSSNLRNKSNKKDI